MFRYFLTCLIVLASVNVFSQSYEVSGTVSDIKTNKPLEFVTIKVADTTYGTTADKDGKFFIRLKKGGATLIFSYIGYRTDSSSFYIEDKDIQRNIFLQPSDIMTEAIEVYGEDPAYDIIRKAIKYKKEFQKNLNEYEYDAFSKFVIRSNRSEIPKTDLQKDSAADDRMAIYGILESETKGYFRKPDLTKQIIIAKKETSNITRGFALPLIVNFYEEKVDFNEFKIPTPLSDDAFDNYEYRLIGTTSMDSTRIFRIEVTNATETRPLFNGVIYIADSLFALMKVDLSTNDAAKPLGIKKIKFIQKFTDFSDTKKSGNTFWMPTDVQIYADGSFAGLVKYEADIFTIVSNYELNKKAPKGIFDDIVIKVMPDAKKDSAYWAKNQLIKNTYEERQAYKQIEIEDEKKNSRLNIGITNINYGKYLTTSPLNYYHYNRVEGSALEFDLAFREKLNRFNANGFLGYGFSDKKTKYKLEYTHRLFNDRRMVISGEIFRELSLIAYENLLGISELDNTIRALFDKKDNFDYYYASGYDLSLSYRFIPQFRAGIGFNQQKQTTAYTNTNFSFRKKNVEFSRNPQINDAFQRVIRFSARIDPNIFRGIDWGDGDISRFRTTRFPYLDLGFRYSGKNAFNSTYDYRAFTADLFGRNYINSLFNLRYRLGGELMNGQVPYQSLAYFNANSGTIDINTFFKAMSYNEFLGDKLWYFNLENNFGKLFFGNVPVLKDFNFIGFFGAGGVTVTKQNYDLAAFKDFKTTQGVYMEAGFGISRILELFRLDFAWRLNNPYTNNQRFFFNFSVDTF